MNIPAEAYRNAGCRRLSADSATLADRRTSHMSIISSTNRSIDSKVLYVWSKPTHSKTMGVLDAGSKGITFQIQNMLPFLMFGVLVMLAIILLNGQIFRVRSNLYAFLRHAAKHKHFSETPFWIDAISINQLDIGEEKGQVRHMGAIYSKASRVIARLGQSAGSLVVRTRPPNRWTCCDHLDPNDDARKRHSCDWKVPARSFLGGRHASLLVAPLDRSRAWARQQSRCSLARQIL